MSMMYGGFTPSRAPKQHGGSGAVQLVADLLLLNGLIHLYRSGKSPAEIAEFAKKLAKVPVNQLLALRWEAHNVLKGKTTNAPLLEKYFGVLGKVDGPTCSGCGEPVSEGAKFCGSCGRKLVER
jgi:hypothetical protein